jgi:hypothetical protein
MAVKKSKGDFFSKRRSLKESFYPKFLIKKLLQWPLQKGGKVVVFKNLLSFNLKLVHTPRSCRRLDLLFVCLIFGGLFKFRSTNLIFIRRRLVKTVKKKIYGHIKYHLLEKSSVKIFSSLFNKIFIEKRFVLFFLIQKLLIGGIIKKYRKQCYSSLTFVSLSKKPSRR